jgi:hypothetical protein
MAGDEVVFGFTKATQKLENTCGDPYLGCWCTFMKDNIAWSKGIGLSLRLCVASTVLIPLVSVNIG